MEIQKFRLVPDGDGFTLLLFLDENQTEFAAELGDLDAYTHTKQNIRQEIKQILKQNFKNVKVNTVRIMVGTMLVTSFPIGAFTAEAASSVSGTNTTQVTTEAIPYMTHIVQRGDTLTRIANLYGTSIDELMTLNNLKGDMIFVGQSVKLPALSYTVVPGDTLFSIAMKFGSSIDGIKATNKLSTNMIFVGQKLVVPLLPAPSAAKPDVTQTPVHPVQEKEVNAPTNPVQEKQTDASVSPVQNEQATAPTTQVREEQATPAAPASPKQEGTAEGGQQQNQSATTYNVISGDTLFLIAKKFNSTVDSIKAANNLKTNMIFVGQRLVIPASVATPPVTATPETAQPSIKPVPEEQTPPAPVQEEKVVEQENEYVVVAGDTLFRIANKLGTSVASIKETNNLTGNTIFVGQKLLIPGATAEKAPVSPSFSVDEPVNSENSTAFSLSGIAEANTTVGVVFKDEAGKTVTWETRTNENGRFTITADLSGLKDGTISASAISSRDGGIKSEASLGIFVKDTMAPVIAKFAGETVVTAKTQNSFIIKGQAEPGSIVSVILKDATGAEVKGTAAAANDGTFIRAFDVSPLQDGTITATLTAKDAAGNVGQEGITKITKDTRASAPILNELATITQKTAGDYRISGKAEEGATVLFTISDGINPAVTGKATVGEDGNFFSQFDLRELNDATLTVGVKQMDRHGNESSVTSVSLEKDTTPAHAPFLSPLPIVTGANESAFLFEGTGEAGSSIFLLIRDGNGQERAFQEHVRENGAYSFSVDLSGLEGTQYEAEVYQEDKFGNRSESTHQSIQVDVTAPDIAGMDAFATIMQENENRYVLSGTTEANARVELTISDGTATIISNAVSDGEGRFTGAIDLSTLKDGSITVSAVASDEHGNRGAAFEGTVIKDTTVPPVSTVVPDNNGKIVVANVKSYRISGISVEDGGIVHIIISDGENSLEKTALVAGGRYDIPFDLSTLKDGSLTVKVTQEDRAGNKSTAVTNMIQKDTTIEAATVMTSHVAKTASGGYSYTITGQGEANSTIYLSVMGQTGSTMINQTVKTGADGKFTVTMDISAVASKGPFILVKQVDESGNESKQAMVGVFSYKVGSGDTLWRIATQFNTTVDEIMALNRLTSSSLSIGQQLSLPTVASVSSPVFAEEEFFNMGYVYFGSSQNYFDSVRETQGSVNVVSPSYFDLNADGSLKLTPTVDRYFIAAMQSSGMRVVPFLSNHWDRAVGEAALRNREQLSTEIAEMVRLYNLDGVNVDLENITHEYRDEYTDFVRLLREKLPEGKEVSVAVAANPNGWTKGWHGSYDYEGLAKYSDYLMIMAYDESYTGSDPGPIASIGWVERSIQYALDHGVDEKQIVLGVGHYGRYWKDGASYGGEGISNAQIDYALERYGGTVTYDENTQSAKAVFTVKQGDPIMKVNGKELTPGTYTVWYENADAIKAKIDLIHKYDIKGLGNWSLGQENPQLWDDFAAWLNPTVPVNGVEK